MPMASRLDALRSEEGFPSRGDTASVRRYTAAMKVRALLFLFLSFQSLALGKTTRIVILGDSLTAGYGVSKESAFPAQLEKKLKAKGKAVEVIAAGISGSTSASGLRRLRWQLKQKPDVLLLALGANDGLRGIKVEKTRENLNNVIEEAKKFHLKVILVGMKLPPNYGETYRGDFEKMFVELAAAKGVGRIPFLLEGVAGVPTLNLEDGIHPNEKGHEKIAEHILPFVKEVL